MLKYNPKLKANARQLRQNLTDSELSLWRRLRGKQLAGVQFYRQKPIGRYIVDFYAPKAKLVIEIDVPSILKPLRLQRTGNGTNIWADLD